MATILARLGQNCTTQPAAGSPVAKRMASFSEQLKNESEPIWQRIFDRPFLKEIKEGTLPEETFRFYLLQDYLYLGGWTYCGPGPGESARFPDISGLCPQGHDTSGGVPPSKAVRRGEYFTY